MIINVFTPEECQEIMRLSDGYFDKQRARHPDSLQVYYDRVKNLVVSYMTSNGITMSESSDTKFMIVTTSTEAAKKWHYDDVTILNFIINIQGEGTKVLINDNIEILPIGYGCMIVGDQGYTMCGLKPVLHCAPLVDLNRCVMKFVIIPNDHITRDISGPSVCEYNSEKYKKREFELKTMLEDELKIIKSF